MDKTVASAADAIADIFDGASLTVGGFGLCGIPHHLISALLDHGPSDLEVVSNNCGTNDGGLGLLLRERRIRRVTASYVGENDEFARQYLAGELELELCPQGTLAERLRAGGAGVPAFYTPTGFGTLIADGGLPWRYDTDGRPVAMSPPRLTMMFDGTEHVLEHAITCDFALVRAQYGDRHGNLVFAGSARNFNPLCAMAGRTAIAEVEHLVEPGDLDPNRIHTPGVYVQRVVEVGTHGKRIERVVNRPAVTAL